MDFIGRELFFLRNSLLAFLATLLLVVFLCAIDVDKLLR